MATCKHCFLWYFTRYTEKTYGMGVGVCGADGSQTFGDHKCPFVVKKDEQEGE